MSLARILSELTRGVPGCIASGLVDMQTGTVVDCKASERSFREQFEILALSAASVFNAAPASVMNSTAGPSDRQDVTHHFREVTLIGKGQVQVYCRPDHNPDLALIVVCQTSATLNLGMVLAKARLHLAAVDAHVA